MEDLNWKLVLLRFVWVLGQQPCWSPAMCLQAFSVFVWDKWGCNVLRHQTKGPKKPHGLERFQNKCFLRNQAGMHHRNQNFNTMTWVFIGSDLQRTLVLGTKNQWRKTSDGPKSWRMTNNFPSESWGPFYITTFDGPWWFVWCLMDTDFRRNTIVAMVFCHAPHFILYIYIYIYT